MSDNVSFQEENQYEIRPQAAPKRKGFSSLIVRLGLAPDEKGAELVLMVVAGVSAIAALGIFLMSGEREYPPPTPVLPMNTPYER